MAKNLAFSTLREEGDGEEKPWQVLWRWVAGDEWEPAGAGPRSLGLGVEGGVRFGESKVGDSNGAVPEH